MLLRGRDALDQHPCSLVATIVAKASLDDGLLQSMLRTVRDAGGTGATARWLDQGIAADIDCPSGLTQGRLREVIDFALSGLEIDVIVQNAAARRKKALFLDMEATFIEQELLDEMARKTGRYEEVCAITREGMEGRLDFAESLKKRAMLFKGQPASLLDETLRCATLSPGAKELVAAMGGSGAVCVLVSGGFTCFVEPIARTHGFTRCFANRLTMENGAISGEVEEPVFDKLGKLRAVEQVAREYGLQLSEIACAGDGGNDRAMIDAVNAANGLGVAWRGKSPLAHVPHQLRHSTLRAILYAQGYTSISSVRAGL